MTMTPGLRKFALTAHVASSVGSLGAVAGFLVLAVAGLTSKDSQVVLPFWMPPPTPKRRFDSNIDARDDSLVLDPREEEMRAIAFFAGVLMATPSIAAEH
jgi:hypothetical protein